MKLSIIVPIYKKSKYLHKYLERVIKLNTKAYEIVFIVDTNNEKVLEVIEASLSSLKGSHQLIYNSKRRGRNNAIALGIQEATGEYLMIHSLTNKFDENFVDNLLEVAQSKKADVIEFLPHVTSPIRYKAKLRKEYPQIAQIKDNIEILAYTYPIIFNKIFRKEVVQKALELPSITKKVNNRFSIALLYKIMVSAQTYITINLAPMKSVVKKEKVFNPLNLAREWDQILGLELFQPYHQELLYAQYFQGLFIIAAYIKIFKNPIMEKKFWKRFNNDFSPENDWFTLNKYYLSHTPESNVMRKLKDKRIARAYKEL